MIHFQGTLPRKCAVAFSGGSDSVAVADFLLNGKRDVSLAFFHHGTRTSDEALEFCRAFASKRGVELHTGFLNREKPKELSLEEFWRIERLEFFRQFDSPVITAHHLDDVVETWIFTSFHGEPRLIPYSNGVVIRPFLLTPKQEFIAWCQRHRLEWVEDKSNHDVKFMRNRIRHNIVPEALLVNPGLRKVLKKKLINATKI